jgi:hypothetical protein
MYAGSRTGGRGRVGACVGCRRTGGVWYARGRVHGYDGQPKHGIGGEAAGGVGGGGKGGGQGL